MEVAEILIPARLASPASSVKEEKRPSWSLLTAESTVRIDASVMTIGLPLLGASQRCSTIKGLPAT